MSPAGSSRASTGQVRRQAAASRRRSAQRRPPPRKRKKRKKTSKRRPRRFRRAVAIAAATLGLGFIAGLVLTNGDRVGDTLREVTLPLRHEDIIRQQAEDKDVDADLIAAIIFVESRFRDQTSSAGARGLMQITPNTAEEIEKLSGGETFEYDDLADPDLNIRYGTFYLRHLLDRYDGNEVAAIAAYNAGPGKAEEWGGSDLEVGDIEFPETQDYVEEVIEKREAYRGGYADELGL